MLSETSPTIKTEQAGLATYEFQKISIQQRIIESLSPQDAKSKSRESESSDAEYIG